MSAADSVLRRYQVFCLVILAASIVSISLWGGMLYDRVSPNPQMSGIMNLAGFPLAAILSSAGLGLSLWFDSKRWRAGASSVAVGVLLAWTAVSLYGSPHLHAGLVVFGILASSVALGWAVFALRLTRAAIMGLAMCLVTAASIVAGLGISEYIAHITRTPRDFSWRVFSTLATPNFLAGYLVMTIPVTSCCFLAARERMVKLLCGMGLTLQLACVFLTGSRFGLLCLGIALAITGIIAARRGLIAGVSGRKGKIVGTAILAVALLGSIPVGIRLFRTGAESHSSQFRLYTWRGAVKMTTANPIRGTGLGSYDAAHAPYSEVAYTQHAHNTYLQLAAESGLPAALLLLLIGGLAAARAARAARNVPTERESAEFEEFDPMRTATTRATSDHAAFDTVWIGAAPGLLAAGVAGGLSGALLRNLFDSDLYVPSIAFTFALLCGLAAALSGADESAETEPSPIRLAAHRFTGALGLILGALFLAPYAIGRLQARAGEMALRTQDGGTALSAYESAARWDFLEAESRLKLASLREATGEFDVAENEHLAATALLRSGKPRYQFAQFLKRRGQLERAISWFERARNLEPNNLQNLLALAESYRAASREADSERTYRHIVALYERPYGQVRAIPEFVEFEFGEAYRALAEMDLERADRESAEMGFRKAITILEALWRSRGLEMVQVQIRPERMARAAEKLGDAQASLEKVLLESERSKEAAEILSRKVRLAEEIVEWKAESDRGIR